MKKLLYSLVALCALTFTSCDKDEPGGTATQKMAGQWSVVIDALDENGELIYEDPFELGNILILTYNTNSNKPTEMYIDDLDQFWEFQAKVSVNQKAMTFGNEDWVLDTSEEFSSWVTDGKIVKNGAVTPSGMPADAIEFIIAFDNDTNGDYGIAAYLVHGFRYTGLVDDEL